MRLIYHADQSVTVIVTPLVRYRVKQIDDLPEDVWREVHATTAADMITNHTSGHHAHEGLPWTQAEDCALVKWLACHGNVPGRSTWACCCRAARLGLRGWRKLLVLFNQEQAKMLVAISKQGAARRSPKPC